MFFGDLELHALKLQHINIFLALLLLSLVNLIVESKAWKYILQSHQKINFINTFRVVCECYPIMSFSSNFLGAVLGKQSFFGTRKVGTNIYKNISFGIYQSISSIIIGLIAIVYLRFGAISIDYNWTVAIYILIAIVFVTILFTLLFNNGSEKFKILLMTSFRSIVYYLQYVLIILHFYDQSQFALAISIIALYFIIKTLIPILNIFGGIGTRELTLSVLFTQMGMDATYIVFGAVMIWLSNFVFPNILGLISFCKRRFA